jgi:hypothetical protein
MQFVSQSLFSTLAPNEFFQGFELLFVASLDSLRIVKNITPVIGEHKFVVDAVLASLVSCLEATEEKYCCY